VNKFGDSNFVSLAVLELDTDEVTKIALIELLEIERGQMQNEKFMTRSDYRRVILDAAERWSGN